MKVFTGGRRGRPREERRQRDEGTPELQGRKAAMAAGGDPALTEYPLGLLLLHGFIGAEQHEAGCYYAFLYGRAIGRTHVGCERQYRQMMAGWGPDRGPLPDEAQAQIESLFRQGKNRLLAAGRRVCDATENVVVFGRAPRFLHDTGRKSAPVCRADAIERESLHAGLDVLVACYGRAAGRAGRMEEHKAPSMRLFRTEPVREDEERYAVAAGAHSRLTR